MASTRYSMDFRKVRFAFAFLLSAGAGLYLWGVVLLNRIVPAIVPFPDRAGFPLLVLGSGCLCVAWTALNLLMLPPLRAVRISRAIASLALGAGHIFLSLPAFAFLLEVGIGIQVEMPFDIALTFGIMLAAFWYAASFLCRRMLRGVERDAGLLRVA